MKKNVILLCLFLMLATPVFAFLYDVKLPTQEEMASLTDKQLFDLYTDIIVERKANETFYGTSGFTPNEYKKYKELLKAIIVIRTEMLKRNVDVPPIEEWLN